MKEDGRQSIRIVAPIPITVIAEDDPPRPAVTAVVNRHGALVLSPSYYDKGLIVWMRNDVNSATVRCRVVWIGLADAGGAHKLGVEFLDEALTFWDPTYADAVRAMPGTDAGSASVKRRRAR